MHQSSQAELQRNGRLTCSVWLRWKEISRNLTARFILHVFDALLTRLTVAVTATVTFSAAVCFRWFITKAAVRGEHAFKVLRTDWDNVSCEGWNSVLAVGGETTESSKHFITRALCLMKYCHVRHLLQWTLNYPWSHLEVRFPGLCVWVRMYFMAFRSTFPHGYWIWWYYTAHVTCIKFVNKQMTFYSRPLGQVSVTALSPVLWLC